MVKFNEFIRKLTARFAIVINEIQLLHIESGAGIYQIYLDIEKTLRKSWNGKKLSIDYQDAMEMIDELDLLYQYYDEYVILYAKKYENSPNNVKLLIEVENEHMLRIINLISNMVKNNIAAHKNY